MGDEPTTPPNDPQAGNSGDPQPQAGAITTPEPQAGDGNETISLEKARELRSESANLRKRLKEFEALNTELKTFKERTESEKLTDTEKREAAQKKLEQQLSEHQARNNELLRAYQDERLNSEVLRQASKLNIIDTDAAAKLIDASRIEYDESGRPTNVPELLKELAKERPWLVGSTQRQQTSGGATNPSRGQTSGLQNITKEEAQRIMQSGKDEFNKLSPEEKMHVRRALNPNLFRN